MILRGTLHQPTQVDDLFAKLDLAMVNPRHVEEVVHQPRKMRALPVNDACRPLCSLAARASVPHELHGVADRRKRVAKFVSQQRQECILRPSGGLEFGMRLLLAAQPFSEQCGRFGQCMACLRDLGEVILHRQRHAAAGNCLHRRDQVGDRIRGATPEQHRKREPAHQHYQEAATQGKGRQAKRRVKNVDGHECGHCPSRQVGLARDDIGCLPVYGVDLRRATRPLARGRIQRRTQRHTLDAVGCRLGVVLVCAADDLGATVEEYGLHSPSHPHLIVDHLLPNGRLDCDRYHVFHCLLLMDDRDVDHREGEVRDHSLDHVRDQRPARRGCLDRQIGSVQWRQRSPKRQARIDQVLAPRAQQLKVGPLLGLDEPACQGVKRSQVVIVQCIGLPERLQPCHSLRQLAIDTFGRLLRHVLQASVHGAALLLRLHEHHPARKQDHWQKSDRDQQHEVGSYAQTATGHGLRRRRAQRATARGTAHHRHWVFVFGNFCNPARLCARHIAGST